MGSVFSPYYAWRRRRGEADPEDHCALNVALYGDGAKRWAMTERRHASIRRERHVFTIGPSDVSWDNGVLTFRIDEVGAPAPRRLRGVVRVYPSAMTGQSFALDDAGRHVWSPLAPCARVEVRFDQPATTWMGDGYLDMNAGERALENDFSEWQWSRAKLRRGTAIVYAAKRREGGARTIAVMADASGHVERFEPGHDVALPATLWRIKRSVPANQGEKPKLLRTLEDAPFYARSLVNSRVLGESATLIHESLSLDRFRTPLVQAMLPFRMPRALR